MKPLAEFNWRRIALGQRDNLCRPCRAVYHREHYLANKQRYIDQAAQSKRRLMRERTLYLIEFFKSHPCADCGETDAVVLEFDHLRDKSFDIGRGITRRSWTAIMAEIEKCEVVCRNCHQRRESRRRGTTRLILTEE